MAEQRDPKREIFDEILYLFWVFASHFIRFVLFHCPLYCLGLAHSHEPLLHFACYLAHSLLKYFHLLARPKNGPRKGKNNTPRRQSKRKMMFTKNGVFPNNVKHDDSKKKWKSSGLSAVRIKAGRGKAGPGRRNPESPPGLCYKRVVRGRKLGACHEGKAVKSFTSR